MKKYPFDYEDPHPSERWKDAVAIIIYVTAAIAGLFVVACVIASAMGWII